MHDAGTGTDALHFARFHDFMAAHAVLVFQRTGNDIGNDFHIAVRMQAEPFSDSHPVFIDHAKGTETHIAWVVIVGKRKRMVRLQPAMVGIAPVLRISDGNHIQSFSKKTETVRQAMILNGHNLSDDPKNPVTNWIHVRDSATTCT